MAKTSKGAKSVKEKPAKEIETKVEAPEPDKLTPAQIAKKIAAVARQSDQYEFDDRAEGQAVFEHLPPGEYNIQEGSRTVIQKL